MHYDKPVAEVAGFVVQSASESSNPMGSEAVIDRLTRRLHDGLQATITYLVQAMMCRGWGYTSLGSQLEQEAMEEFGHARDLIERLVFFDEVPEIRLPALTFGSSVLDILREVKRLEEGAVRGYNESALVAEREGDQGSRSLFVRRVNDEEGHLDWALAQLAFIEQAGLGNYLAEQAEPASFGVVEKGGFVVEEL